MASSWSKDSKTVATSSMDGTVKLCQYTYYLCVKFCSICFSETGDVETRQVKQTWTLGKGLLHQQVANAWNERGDIISMSMSGVLNIFDERVGDSPSRYLAVRIFILSSLSLSEF